MKYPGMLKWLPRQRRKGPGGRWRGTKSYRGRDGVESQKRVKKRRDECTEPKKPKIVL